MSDVKYKDAYTIKFIDINDTFLDCHSVGKLVAKKVSESFEKRCILRWVYIDPLESYKDYVSTNGDILKIMAYVGESGELNVKIVYNLGEGNGLFINYLTYNGKYIVVWKETEE